MRGRSLVDWLRKWDNFARTFAEKHDPSPLTPDSSQTVSWQIDRDAASFDGTTSISAATFFQMMQMVMPCPDRPNWIARCHGMAGPTTEPAIHLVLFVHCGWLHAMVRDPQRLSCIQQLMNPELTSRRLVVRRISLLLLAA